jgi:WD40 repeat protein
MKSIYRILTVILLSLFFQSQTTIDKGTNEISRTEQMMQGLGKLELVIQNGHTGALKGILLSEDKTKLFSYSKDGTIKIWDMNSEKLLRSMEGHTDSIEGIRLSTDANGIQLRKFEKKIFSVRGIQVSKDSKKLFSYTYDNTIKIWDVDEGKGIKQSRFGILRKESFSNLWRGILIR